MDLTFINTNQYSEQMTNASPLRSLTPAELLTAAAPRPDILAPLLAPESTALVWGPPGVGKSFFALALAWAAASGGSFLGWTSPRPHRVMHVDGGLSAARLGERVALFGSLPPGLRLCPLELASDPPDLSTEDGLLALMEAWDEDPELVVLDAPVLRGNGERDSLQRFVRFHRRQRRAVLLVHHANKQGTLSGPMGRALDADLVIALRRAPGASSAGAGAGARFTIHVEKAQRRPAALAPLLVELETDPAGRACWRWRPAEESAADRVARLLHQGLGARGAMAALGLSKSAFYRHRAKAEQRGLLP